MNKKNAASKAKPGSRIKSGMLPPIGVVETMAEGVRKKMEELQPAIVETRKKQIESVLERLNRLETGCESLIETSEQHMRHVEEEIQKVQDEAKKLQAEHSAKSDRFFLELSKARIKISEMKADLERESALSEARIVKLLEPPKNTEDVEPWRTSVGHVLHEIRLIGPRITSQIQSQRESGLLEEKYVGENLESIIGEIYDKLGECSDGREEWRETIASILSRTAVEENPISKLLKSLSDERNSRGKVEGKIINTLETIQETYLESPVVWGEWKLGSLKKATEDEKITQQDT